MADNAALVRQAYESFLAGDIGSVMGMLAPAIRWSVPRSVPQGGEFVGLDAVLTFFNGLDAAWNPLRLEIEALADAGPHLVVAIVSIAGTCAEDAVEYGAVHVFTLDQGQITRFREYVDLDAPFAG
jgi:ketosteroid isomerase-like protein